MTEMMSAIFFEEASMPVMVSTTLPTTSPRRGGIDDEVGDLDNPENDDDQALPGRVGGGLAGG